MSDISRIHAADVLRNLYVITTRGGLLASLGSARRTARRISALTVAATAVGDHQASLSSATSHEERVPKADAASAAAAGASYPLSLLSSMEVDNPGLSMQDALMLLAM